MARRPKANSHDNTIRNVIIGFTVVILIVGGFLIWNNQARSYAGTIDGVRMPVEHFNFFQHEAWEWLILNNMPNDEETGMWAIEHGLERLLELHLAVTHAGQFNLSMANVDQDAVREEAVFLREVSHRQGVDMIAAMGFTNSSLRRFVEMKTLEDLVREHVMDLAVIDPADQADAFNDYVQESLSRLNQVMIRMIEFEDEQMADTMFGMLLANPDNFEEYMEEYSVSFDPDNMVMSIDQTQLAWHPETLEQAHAMEIGDLSGVVGLVMGGYGIFEVVDIIPLMTIEELEEEFIPLYENHIRANHFREMVQEWIDEADILFNERVLG